MNAALECKDINLDVVLLEARPVLGGQLPEISHSIRNVATGWYASGPDLQARLWSVVQLLGNRVRLEHAVSDANLAEGWVEAAGERVRGRALLIASGTAPQRLAVASDGAFGGDVTYQVESDANRFAGRPVVVVGGGDSATLDALFLAPIASSVILAHRAETLTARHDIAARVRAEDRIQDMPGWEVESLEGHERLKNVVLVHRATGETKTVPAGGLIIKISRDPCTGPFRGQVDIDHRGFVIVDGDLCTSCPGVFAAGDVVSGAYWRVANALGHGSLVSRTILRYLQQDAQDAPVQRYGPNRQSGAGT